MATIHAPANGIGYNAEELAANTWPQNKFTPELTPTQLDELRAKARPTVSHNSRAALDIADRQARQKAQDDIKRAEILKGSRESSR